MRRCDFLDPIGNTLKKPLTVLMFDKIMSFPVELTIEMCKEDNPDEARNDVTNTIQYLNEGERNIWFIPQVSEPNPFPSEVATWDQEITSLPSVTVEGGKLKISMISKALTTGMEEKEYNVAFAGFKASFKLRVNGKWVSTSVWLSNQLDGAVAMQFWA